MFFPPSLGVSVIIHLVIIAYHKLFSRFRMKYEIREHKQIILMRGLGVAIVFLISTVIFTGAFSLVKLSFKEKHSSVRFLSFYAVKAFSAISHSNLTEVFAFGSNSDDSKGKPTVTPRDCPVPFQIMASWYKGSLVDFLAAKGYDYSFEARERYAEQFNIGKYTGTHKQNEALLMAFFVKLGQLPPIGTGACKLPEPGGMS